MNNATHTIVDHYDGDSVHVVDEINGIFVYRDALPVVGILNDILQCNPQRVRKGWSTGTATGSNIRSACAMAGYACELRFNAAHGRRYDLVIYSTGNAQKRRVAIAAQCGVKNTNPEIG